MPILRYIHVTKQFAPDSYGVMDVNLEVEPGELVVITGHTGSGKTTLMKLLTREYTVSEGELYFNETPVHELKSGKVHLHRRQIGVVYQDYRLIKDLTVWENVALPLYIAGKHDDEIEQRVSDLLNLIKLTDKATHFPSQLSGGEAQRVSIARSLALAPELIFADEPTGNLDADTSKTIAQLFAKINELGTTVLLSTHDMTLLDVFTDERHVQLEKGAVVKDSGSKKGLNKTAAKADLMQAVSEAQSTQSENKSEPESDTSAKKPFWHALKMSKKSEDETAPAQSGEESAEDKPHGATKSEPDTDEKAEHAETSELKHKPSEKKHHTHKHHTAKE